MEQSPWRREPAESGDHVRRSGAEVYRPVPELVIFRRPDAVEELQGQGERYPRRGMARPGGEELGGLGV
jgi:hypothetical protein